LQLQLLGLLDNQFGVALPEAAFSLPITILILRPFMRAVPGELEDAALVDGAGRLRFFVQLMLPMCKPALITVGLLAFVTSWNQFLLPLLDRIARGGGRLRRSFRHLCGRGQTQCGKASGQQGDRKGKVK